MCAEGARTAICGETVLKTCVLFIYNGRSCHDQLLVAESFPGRLFLLDSCTGATDRTVDWSNSTNLFRS